jgi:DMSO/TMAO reductase YedYZ molybdopterin-dependent catalytic subunit
MAGQVISRGFFGKRRTPEQGQRVPPGQYITPDFPVLSAGPTPRIPLSEWSFYIQGLIQSPLQWSWDDFMQLPSKSYKVDIHCVTKWTRLDTEWEGVSVDTLLSKVQLDPRAAFVTVHSYGDYTTNLPLADLVNDQAFIAFRYGGEPLAPEHGGPARLVVPHLYFWKSAKWVNGFHLMEHNQSGFWESLGYHDYGDPWKEQRYQGD